MPRVCVAEVAIPALRASARLALRVQRPAPASALHIAPGRVEGLGECESWRGSVLTLLGLVCMCAAFYKWASRLGLLDRLRVAYMIAVYALVTEAVYAFMFILGAGLDRLLDLLVSLVAFIPESRNDRLGCGLRDLCEVGARPAAVLVVNRLDLGDGVTALQQNRSHLA
jgi:hypothetical protein